MGGLGPPPAGRRPAARGGGETSTRTALVTAGAGGIGAACASRLADDGLRVITADLAAGADEHVDVTDPDSVLDLRRRVGRVDVLSSPAPGSSVPPRPSWTPTWPTGSLGKELATTGVLVDAIAPAAVTTPMNAATDSAVLERSQRLTPMGRFGRPEEIAELAAWLCSDAVSFSTGAVYDASGGRASY